MTTRLVGLEPELLAEVKAGLTSTTKRLPASLLYDELGTALFEAISYLPEYGLTRADERILRANAGAIMRALTPPLVVAELGSGSGRKTRPLLEALASRQAVSYYPIDISPTALERCETELDAVSGVKLTAIQGDYVQGLLEAASRRPPGHQMLVLFLGSTIGNFEPGHADSFLRDVRRAMREGDGLLLGTDLVKPAAMLVPAYDDPLGVTAAFNKNLLARLNREAGATFDLARFRHEARWRETERRIEMHLVARRAHEVRVGAIDRTIAFREGESIWTESSYKFRLEDVDRLARSAHFEPVARWTDSEWPFAETLLRAR
ncbi:MAG TPA: L-histidine N(alpha)-methyltransferase [Candidatus Eisenbacteria bacterium]|nr:L-histidine N(alpha)-methyltransferase [Candidatus Eisenbacteria bacterium]